MSAKDWFEEVWVVNLKRRPQRLEGFWREMERVDWPFRRPRVFEAIDGEKVTVPEFWKTGPGSYGCLRSHLNILERAIMNDVKTLLVLEDDAVFTESFQVGVVKFLNKVPADWQCLMLGGQHIESTPVSVGAGIVRPGIGGGIQRTHCYALRGPEVMKALYRVWAEACVHCDWVMGPRMVEFNTYAPDPFLVIQTNGRSDVSSALRRTKRRCARSGVAGQSAQGD